MEAFCQKHEGKIAGVLSCFDRMLFCGYLPIMSGASMAQFLQSERVNCENLKHFLLQLAGKVSRLLRRLHLYGLIAKVPHARRWRVTKKGLRVFSSAVRFRDYVFPELYATACG